MICRLVTALDPGDRADMPIYGMLTRGQALSKELCVYQL